jgi:hypothetical protein
MRFIMLNFSNGLYAKFDKAGSEYTRLKGEALNLGYSTVWNEKLDKWHTGVGRLIETAARIQNSNFPDIEKNEQFNRIAKLVQKYLDLFETVSTSLKTIKDTGPQKTGFPTTPDDIEAMNKFPSARPQWYWASSGENT